MINFLHRSSGELLYFLHQNVKTLNPEKDATSKFEVDSGDIVIAQGGIVLPMESNNLLVNLEEDQCLDRATAEQLAKIVEFLLNLED